MRTPVVVLSLLLLAGAGVLVALSLSGGDDPPDSPRPENAPDSGAPRAGDEPPPPAPSDATTEPDRPAEGDTPIPGEPAAWARLDLELAEEPDPATERTRKNLETMNVYVSFEKTSLPDVVKFLAEQARTELAIDERLYEERSPQELLVTLPAGPTTVAECLDAIAKSLHIAWWVEGERARIAPFRPREEARRVTIPLGPVCPTGGLEPDAVADMIREKIDFVVWEEEGEIEIDHDANALRVKAPPATLRKILKLLRALRTENR
jgi:hypothetical protein